MGKNNIIVVANQKGGVGKSTVCIALANYLTVCEKKLLGGVIDTDSQKSILKVREADLEHIKGTSLYPPYEVTYFSLDHRECIPDLAAKLRQTGNMYLIDTPGSITLPGIATFITVADTVVIPFSYDKLTLDSTMQFLQLWRVLEQQLDASGLRKPGLIFVECRKNSSIGTATERELWKTVRTELGRYGRLLSSSIPELANLKRLNTIMLSKAQEEALKAPLHELYDILDNKDNPTPNETQSQ